LAPQLAELIVSQGDEKILKSHRREIVVVFCDLRGYTAFTETAEPEESSTFCTNTMALWGRSSPSSRGTLDQFSGDGIMVFFNDPIPIPRPRLNARYRFSKGTLAGTRGNGRDAPIRTFPLSPRNG
jgi:adenylate cyclase